jgi:hypothetical protein
LSYIFREISAEKYFENMKKEDSKLWHQNARNSNDRLKLVILVITVKRKQQGRNKHFVAFSQHFYMCRLQHSEIAFEAF